MGDLDEFNLEDDRTSSADKKVMIVEDDDEIRHLLEVILEKEGFHFESAADGEAGLDRIREYMPDLILLDMMLPRKGGWDVLRQLQAEETARIPIIVMTGRFDHRTSDMVIQESNVVEFVKKPIRPEIFAMMLHKVLKTHPPDAKVGEKE